MGFLNKEKYTKSSSPFLRLTLIDYDTKGEKEDFIQNGKLVKNILFVYRDTEKSRKDITLITSRVETRTVHVKKKHI